MAFSILWHFQRVALASGLSLDYRKQGEVQGTSTETPGRCPASDMLLVEPEAVTQGPKSDMAISVFRRAWFGGICGPERA